VSVELVHPHPTLGEPGTIVTDPELEGQLVAGGYARPHKGSRSAASPGKASIASHDRHAKGTAKDADPS
jgi:hypothetical protein